MTDSARIAAASVSHAGRTLWRFPEWYVRFLRWLFAQGFNEGLIVPHGQSGESVQGQRPVKVRENRMRVQGLKMQTNCVGVSPGKRAAETAGRAVVEEIAGGGGGESFNPPDGGSAVEAGEAGGLDGGVQFGDEQGRGEGSGGVIEGLVLRGDVEGDAAEFADDSMEDAAGRWVG